MKVLHKKIWKVLFKNNKKQISDLHVRLLNLEIALSSLIDDNPYQEGPDVGFNGQQQRKRIFLDLLETFDFSTIYETGTFLGNTTGYMATKSNLPVYSCEINQLFYKMANRRLQQVNNVFLECNDSRTFLTELVNRGMPNEKVFIYLDAHWYDDLPLDEEINLICKSGKDFIIMIDDFQVPGDAGYTFDDFGKNKSLTMMTFSDSIVKNQLVAFFPSSHSSTETGSKRGCVVLARKGGISEKMLHINSLSQRNHS